MTDPETPSLPCVVLFNINGSGMGHLSTCLGYANRLRGRARPVFFSLASAIETIHAMGFEPDYFVSRFRSRASGWAWDRQLALLGLRRDGRYALFSLGPGNLKDVSGIGRGLIDEMQSRGYEVVWARAPISVKDAPLPEDVISLAVYPLVRFIRAFDVFAGAAGYNTCCEVLPSGVPTLFVPNTQVSDDQARRAELVAQAAQPVVSPCESPEQRTDAVERLLTLKGDPRAGDSTFDLSGAERAADEILALIDA